MPLSVVASRRANASQAALRAGAAPSQRAAHLTTGTLRRHISAKPRPDPNPSPLPSRSEGVSNEWR